MKSSEEGLTKAGLVNCNVTERLAKKMLVYKACRVPRPLPVLVYNVR